MRHNDFNSGAAGLVIVFAGLATLLAAFLPVVKTKGALDASDWLGFSGNVIASAFAVGAAFFAWRAAQRQISEAQRQNGIVAYDVMCRMLDDIIRDRSAIFEARSAIDQAEVMCGSMLETIGAEDIPAGLWDWPDRFEPYLQAVSDAVQAFKVAEGRPWGTQDDMELRQITDTALEWFESSLTDVHNATKAVRGGDVVQVKRSVQVISETIMMLDSTVVISSLDRLERVLARELGHVRAAIFRTRSTFLEATSDRSAANRN